MLISLLFSTLLLAPLSTVVTPTPAVGDDVLFHVDELVYHPTRDGVVLTLVPAQELHLAVAWGPQEPLEFQSGVLLAQPGRPLNIPLTSVDPGGEILYRVYVREADEPRPMHRVQTLPQRGTKYSFGVAADTHAWAVWSKGTCGSSPPPLQQLEQTLENIADDDSLRFLLLGTDIAMTKCGSCSTCEVDGLTVSSGTVSSYTDALLRWRRVLQPDLIGMVGADLPLLVALGDHEGEQGWLNNNVSIWSEEARRQHIPLARASYKGDPDGGYYAVESGDLLLVVLDIHRHTTAKPLSVDDWTLGKAQLAWLGRTLARSKAEFKIVTAEHLLGGLFDPSVTTQKGRGGITATDDGTSTGTFVGEQAQLHELFKTHGVQVFMSFQDHVVAWGEKLGPEGQGEGVTYLIGGRASGVAPPAAALDWYIDAMDYDGDGIPEFETDVTGTMKVGYFRVTVEPGLRLLFEYVRTTTSIGGGGNGDVLFSFAVDPDGHPTQVFPLN